MILCVAVGSATYLIRFVPFLLAQRFGNRQDSAEQGISGGKRLRVLELIGPSIVAALLITAILPQPGEANFDLQLIRSLLALAPVLVSAVIWKNLGLSVIVGVSSYWLISLVL